VYQGQVFLYKAQKWLGKKLISHAFLLVGYCFGTLLSGSTGFDEAYYLYSLHLDWSYFDHPVWLRSQLALVPG